MSSKSNILPVDVVLELSEKVAGYFKLHGVDTPYTYAKLDACDHQIQEYFYNDILKAFAKDPLKFKKIDKKLVDTLSIHLQRKSSVTKSFKLKHSLYAGMLLRHSNHLQLDSLIRSRLYTMVGVNFTLEELLNISHNKFYTDPFTVALSNISHVLEQCKIIWKLRQANISDNYFLENNIEIVAHMCCDNYKEMLDDISILTKDAHYNKRKIAGMFLLNFPFINHLTEVGISQDGVKLINKSFIRAMLFLIGIDEKLDATYSKRLNCRVDNFFANENNVSYIVNSCRVLLTQNINDGFAENFLPIIIKCLRDGELDDRKLNLINVMKKCFSEKTVNMFDKMLTKDVQLGSYEPSVLKHIYDLGLGLRNFTHIFEQIKGFIAQYGEQINEFIETYHRRQLSKDLIRKYMRVLGHETAEMKLISALWSVPNSFNLDSKIKRKLACLGLNAKDFKIDTEDFIQIIKHILIFCRLSYECAPKKDIKQRINTLVTAESFAESLEKTLGHFVEPNKVFCLTMQPIVKHRDEKGFYWCGAIDALIHRVAPKKWAFYDPSLQQQIVFSSIDNKPVVEHLLTRCKKSASAFAEKFIVDDFELVLAPITFYPQSIDKPLLFANRRSQTLASMPSERNPDIYETVNFVRSGSSPNFGSLKYII